MTEITPPLSQDRLNDGRLVPGIVYGLYLCGVLTFGGSVIIALIVAYANLADAAPKTFSHYRFAIRTFWLSFAWFFIGGLLIAFGLPLSLVLIGLPFLWLGKLIFFSVGIWFVVRTIAGLIYLSRDQAYPRPKTWLV